MSFADPYKNEENLINVLWEFLPGIIKFLSFLGIAAIAILGSQAYLSIVDLNSAKDSNPIIQDLTRKQTPVYGNLDSNTTVYIASDFLCPFCAQYHNDVNLAMEQFGSEVKFAFKYYPINNSINSPNYQIAFAAQAAHNQGFYKEFANIAYGGQQDFKTRGSKIIEDWASSIEGMDIEKWNVDRNSSEVRSAVRVSAQDLDKLFLPSSPNSGGKSKQSGSGLGTPTTIIIKDGEIIDWWSGANSPALFKVLSELTGANSESSQQELPTSDQQQ